ncbi:unnamed protein product, partial [Onchocerca ochengi]|uniref:Conserved secreted protein n=1 Tax=Onchocerca ochengi TaxID=42157 RepID=A0A182ER65_ONCOC
IKMLPNTAKLISFLIIHGFMQINAQELPQRTAKTFANTQFDLDPNLPFDDHTTAASESSDISRRKSFISVKIQPATATPLLQTTIIAQEVMQVKPKSSKSKFQYQNVRNPSRKAPRAKPYYIVTSDVSNFIQTELKTAEIPSNQLQSTIEKQKLSTKIIRNAETNSSNQVPLLQTLKIPPVRKVLHQTIFSVKIYFLTVITTIIDNEVSQK